MKLNEIGKIKSDGEVIFIQINKQYIQGLHGLEGFSHIDVLWWCNNWPISYEESGNFDWESEFLF